MEGIIKSYNWPGSQGPAGYGQIEFTDGTSRRFHWSEVKFASGTEGDGGSIPDSVNDHRLVAGRPVRFDRNQSRPVEIIR